MAKLIELAKIWSNTAATFGGAGTFVMLYFTDWKAVLQFMPVYNTKYSDDVK
ncbi:ubiquinol-cytochrome C reductase-like [Tropilaelaps mercedesae]|uniref:Ubiquinol-cytochrome C reductase-like n=1 Tax=Tropilaelaps mercedesae TaxID=418985 RepID=A0A1V9X412_9ACAR|nr:ubiquinol-cytochrome C reductase-like [Tropilaelaps mercedesae]